MARATFTFNDHSNELSSFSVNAEESVEATFEDNLTAAAALGTAAAALSIASYVKRQVAQIPFDSPATPSNFYAQREIKWRVSYRGAISGKLFQIEIPAPLQTANTVNGNTDNANVSDTLWTNFITAFEAYAKSPDDNTEGVEFVGAKLVGRNI